MNIFVFLKKFSDIYTRIPDHLIKDVSMPTYRLLHLQRTTCVSFACVCIY